MRESSLRVELPYAVQLPTGDEATTATVRLLTQKERRELGKRYKSDQMGYTQALLRTRVVRLGELENVVDEIFDDMPTPVYDFLIEAMVALDSGFGSVEDYRASDEYNRTF